MYPLNTLSILAIATLAAAAPAPAEQLDERAPSTIFNNFGSLGFDLWEVVGYGNPNCQGDVMWTEKGIGRDCRNVPREAASYKWRVWQPTDVRTFWTGGSCSAEGHVQGTVFVQENQVGIDGRRNEGCFDMTMVHGFEIKILERE